MLSNINEESNLKSNIFPGKIYIGVWQDDSGGSVLAVQA